MEPTEHKETRAVLVRRGRREPGARLETLDPREPTESPGPSVLPATGETREMTERLDQL